MQLFFVTFQAGHWVTVYERNDRCGGLLMYGVPPMKLSKKVDKASLVISKEEIVVVFVEAETQWYRWHLRGFVQES